MPAPRADVQRDGEWSANALRRVVENNSGSESVGCRIGELVSGDIKMSRTFAQLLLAHIETLQRAAAQSTR